MLDCRKQNFIEGGKAYILLAIWTLFVSIQEQSSIYFFQIPRAGLEEDKLNPRFYFASTQRKRMKKWVSEYSQWLQQMYQERL